MNRDINAPGEQTLAWVAEQLKQGAQALRLPAGDMQQLIANSFDGGTGSPGSSLEARDLPIVKHGLTIGRHAIVLGLLPEMLGDRELADTMRQYRNQCVVARSMLPPNSALDLLLVLVGPRGSEGKDAWRALALGVERDDRVARKLCWLRPQDRKADPDSFACFVKRSFLSRPWESDRQFSVAALDEVSAAVDIEDAPRDTAGQWNQLAIEWGKEPDTLVDKLIEAWKVRSAT